jgi:hypothetical protein
MSSIREHFPQNKVKHENIRLRVPALDSIRLSSSRFGGNDGGYWGHDNSAEKEEEKKGEKSGLFRVKAIQVFHSHGDEQGTPSVISLK